jgi:hypothetical protein
MAFAVASGKQMGREVRTRIPVAKSGVLRAYNFMKSRFLQVQSCMASRRNAM